ncbi:energy transducer TonB [Salibacteraceae bacterium]|nr:energy transducer TonB [Salibacteraceae bacterium]
MKKNRLTLTCIFISLYSLALSQDFIHPLAIQESENELVYFMNEDKEIIPEGLPYSFKREAIRKKTKKPYRVIDYYPNGAIEMKTWMSHPDPISKRYQKGFISFFQNGDTNIFIEYKDQRKNGEYRAYYESGQLKQYGRYINGKTSGAWKSFFKTGSLKDIGMYFQGEKHGVWESYHEVGNKSSSGNYINGKKQGKWEYFYSTGDILKVSNYVDDELDGPYKMRYSSGEALEYGEYVKGKKEGEWNTFYVNAQKRSIRHYENDILEGPFHIKDEVGETLTEGEMYSGLFNGFSRYYSRERELILERYYQEGLVMNELYLNSDRSPKRYDRMRHDGLSSVCYDISGNEVECMTLTRSLPHGEMNLERQLAKTLVVKKYENYSPRGVYSFDVDTLGNPVNVHTVESTNMTFDEEVIVKIKDLSWDPGVELGQKVVFSNHVVVHFDQDPTVRFGDFYLNDSNIYNGVNSYDPDLDNPDQFPSFRVGMQGLIEYMAAETKYPEEAKNEGIKGICVAKFAVEPSGIISELEMVRTVHPLLDYESVRLVEEMPNWIPGTTSGEKTKMYQHLPIRFTLN